MIISSQSELEESALTLGILPFFRNNIPGFSVEEMTAPGMLFGGNEYDGCWEWKGPVVRSRTTAYGKFFRKKAGFVSRELLPLFLRMRRMRYPVAPDSADEMIYEIISLNDRMTSTELRLTLDNKPRKRTAADLPEIGMTSRDLSLQEERQSFKKSQLEGPLQRLQMGGWLCISDFKYKQTKKGERYGWGVAEYSTPEMLFDCYPLVSTLSEEECMDAIITYVGGRFPAATPDRLKKLLS